MTPLNFPGPTVIHTLWPGDAAYPDHGSNDVFYAAFGSSTAGNHQTKLRSVEFRRRAMYDNFMITLPTESPEERDPVSSTNGWPYCNCAEFSGTM
jgi:hypothetical protein